MWAFLHVFGVPEGQSREFYRNVVLAFIALPATILAAVFALTDRFNTTPFWTAAAIVAVCLAAATQKAAIISAVLIFAGLRFAFAFLTTLRPEALIAAVACIFAAIAVLMRASEKKS